MIHHSKIRFSQIKIGIRMNYQSLPTKNDLNE